MKRFGGFFRAASLFLLAAAVADQLRRPADQRTWHGQIAFFPYDFRLPTPERLKMRLWNPADPRIFTPHVFGVGWTLNLYQVKHRLQMLIS